MTLVNKAFLVITGKTWQIAKEYISVSIEFIKYGFSFVWELKSMTDLNVWKLFVLHSAKNISFVTHYKRIET